MVKQIQSFQTDDGQIFEKRADAVENEIILLFNAWDKELSPSKIAGILAQNTTARADLQQILEQLK